MTLHLSTNQRFADNGDIGKCDTSVEMSAENITGEARLASTPSHIQDIVSTSNILTEGENPCNDPMKYENVSDDNSPHLRNTGADTNSPVTDSKSDLIQASSTLMTDLAGPVKDDEAVSDQLMVTPGTYDLTVITSDNTIIGPYNSPSREAVANSAFSGKMGHKNAISNECSSIGGPHSENLPKDGAGVDLARFSPSSSYDKGASFPTRVVFVTKTVKQYDIPASDTEDDSSFNLVGGGNSKAAPSSDTYTPVTPVAMKSLSDKQIPPRRGGWRIPLAGGLKGGAPLPGETSAISNGTSGWGPPPTASGAGGSGTSGWGAAPAANPSSAWGSPQQNINNGEENQTNSKMLNSIPPSSQAAPSQASQGLVVSQAPGPGQAAVQGSTSWAAAAQKGLPPSDGASQQGSNGTTNKQLEQLNSVREALFSQDGWGCQHVKQDTSWDVGASAAGQATEPPPAAAAAAPAPTGATTQPPKAESMQWTPPNGSGRNDGTDLWRSTLSGVPQPVKPQPSTPWGNHTPAHPADYKTWGEPEDGPSAEQAPPGPPGGDNMWSSGAPGSGPGSSSGAAPGGAWDQDRNNDRSQFDDRDRNNWGGVPKPKEEGMGWNNGSNQWGAGGGGGANVGPSTNNGTAGGWGPPPAKSGAGGGGGWGNNTAPGPAPGQRPQQWEGGDNHSPTMARRFDDGGTSIWGGKSQSGAMTGAMTGPGGPPGGWKDMPVPTNMGARGPPGPGRMPPGPAGAMKPSGDNSPWGHPGRGWDENSGTGGWGGMDDKPRSGDMWNDNKNWNGNRVQQMPGMRSSPSWNDEQGMMGDRAGWGGSGPAGSRPGVNKEIWSSKQFRILCEMGFRKEDVETALRNTNMQLDDALEMLHTLNRGGMPGAGRNMPPNDVFGPRGEPDYGMRFPGPMPGPYPPGSSDMPGGNNGASTSRNMNPSLMNGGPNMHPPRPQPNGPPSTAQLRVLVQQIQMAVQAGHLNPQILNQPLAPQTLYLLNNLLQQIKQLQNCQQQHAMAQAQAGQRPGSNQQQALLALTVQITKHKQQIQNLQNQITAQQAKYLANQHSQPMGGGPGGPHDDLALNMNTMNISENGSGVGAAPGGSKLLQMISNKDNEFSRAPGSAKNSASSPNLLGLDNGPWSNGQGSSGWPDSDKPVNTSNSTDEDNFGIPEFVPGKAWKGTAQMKDPTEDPTMTPGSVASSNIIAPLTTSDKTVTSSSDSHSALSSSTWSLTTPNTKENSTKDSWSSSMGLVTSSGASTLTEMGQNLWGVSRSQSSKQQTPTTSLSTWPSSNGLNSSGGWSNGSTTTTSSSYLGTIGGQSGSGSAWLLLKNLTAQIDGSTLRTLCLQHGPLNKFHLFLTHGIALVKYSNGLEAMKAQNALNNCVLGNTTILAAIAEEQEVETVLRQLQHSGAAGGYNSNISQPAAKAPVSSSGGDTWSSLGSGLGWPSSSLGAGSGSVWGAPDSDQPNRATPQLNSFLPPDLLSEGM